MADQEILSEPTDEGFVLRFGTPEGPICASKHYERIFDGNGKPPSEQVSSAIKQEMKERKIWT